MIAEMREALSPCYHGAMNAPVRYPFPDLARPVWHWINVVTTLRDFAIVTYAVDPAVLARFLAPGFEPHVRTLDDGRRCALISAVPFRDRDFRFQCLPWLRFAMGQTNYRAYVLYRGEPCVWFFGTSLTRPYVYAPVVWWKLPWYPARMWFDTRWSGERYTRYHLHTESDWAQVELDMTGSGQLMGRLDGFPDEEQTRLILSHPLMGYYYRRDGRVGTYSIWHDRLDLRRGQVRHARFALLERLGLIEPGTEPHSVLLQRETEFVIRLPPKPLSP